MKSFSDYFKEYNVIKKTTDAGGAERSKKIRIAVLASSTIKGVEEILFVKCHNLGVTPEIMVGGYNQYNQEILNDASQLYNFKPDLVIVFIDTKSLLGDIFFDYYFLSDKERDDLFVRHTEHITLLMNSITKRLNCKIVLHNFEVPVYSPLGIIDNKQKMGFVEFIRKINSEIQRQFKENSQVFVFDYELFCSQCGKENLTDYKMYYLGDVKISFKSLPRLCEEYISYIKPLTALTKKCIVLDLDNTLWGGIVGEDGIEGIKLGPDPEGRSFWEFQKYLLSLFHRGVILAVNSKNNADEALNVLRTHPHMVLKEKHFASIQINWNDKISNMRAIAKEINIGLDSLVFIDDDKVNKEIVKEALPEVKVIDLSEDPSLYLKTLMELNDFNSFYLSEEDKKRGEMYASQRERVNIAQATSNITEYLQELQTIATIEAANSFTLSRISQLTQKTNQFNMTTKRYSEENIKDFLASDRHLVFSIKVEDKFGDSGIVGAAIILKEQSHWQIDSFLLSCRVIGRGIEDVMLIHIIEEAKRSNIKTLAGQFVATEKNIPAREFYSKSGFKLVEEAGGSQTWKLSIEKEYRFPDFIKVTVKEAII